MQSAKERQYYIQVVILICAAVLVIKAAHLQLIDRSYSRRADATTIERLTVYPSRGLVFDRNQKLILYNNAMYDLMVTYNQVDKNMDVDKFCQIVGMDESDFWETLNKDWRSPKFSKSVPFVFIKKLDAHIFARLQESLYEFPGFFVQMRNIRDYPFTVGAHVLGYINEVNPGDIEKAPEVYQAGDYIGASGLESEYEPILRGEKGMTFLLKDNLGRIVGRYQEGDKDSSAVAGSDMVSSIDIELQAYAELLMQGKTGSVVAIEPSTGEILAMVSAPTYNPKELTLNQNRGKKFTDLLTDPLKPFFDRTVMAKYPPGSIFKSVVSLIGMQEGTINPAHGKSCNGGYFYAGRLYKCHGHGPLRNVVDAMAYSCNTYYFQEFREIIDKYGFKTPEVGLAKFNNYCREFGLGSALGIDYPNENDGNIPDTAYYNRLYPKRLGGWRSPTIMSIGIGQGELQLTTIQMANLAACIANRGWWYRPHLVRRFKDGTPIPRRFTERQVVAIERQYFEYVVEGMAECVNRGTARVAQVPDIQVCGKTGTSQNPHGDDHSVFFAFAPKDDPKIAIAVFVENAGWGSSYAAPIASLMVEKYINRDIASSRKWLEDRIKNANLIDNYLRMLEKKQEQEQARQPAVPRDTLPDENSIPSDVPEGVIGAAPIED